MSIVTRMRGVFSKMGARDGLRSVPPLLPRLVSAEALAMWRAAPVIQTTPTILPRLPRG